MSQLTLTDADQLFSSWQTSSKRQNFLSDVRVDKRDLEFSFGGLNYSVYSLFPVSFIEQSFLSSSPSIIYGSNFLEHGGVEKECPMLFCFACGCSCLSNRRVIKRNLHQKGKRFISRKSVQLVVPQRLEIKPIQLAVNIKKNTVFGVRHVTNFLFMPKNDLILTRCRL